MLISVKKDKDLIVSGQKNSLIVLGKRAPKIGDRLKPTTPISQTAQPI